MNYKIGKRYFASYGILIPAVIMLAVGSIFLFGALRGILPRWTEFWADMFASFKTNPNETFALSWVFALCFGLPLAGILMIIIRLIRRVSDETYEKTIAEYPCNLDLRARETLSLSETEELCGPVMVFEDFKYHNVLEVKHNNGRVRTDLYQKSVVFLTEKYLYTYSLTFRTVKSEEVINTEVLSYQDIVSVTLTQKNDTLRREDICIKYLEISTVGGNVIKLPYRYDEQAQQDVNMIRQIWRTKKAETV